MAKDFRLDLGRYIDYTKDVFVKQRKLNFDDLFAAKSGSNSAPWTPSRFQDNDLLKKIQTRKLQLNPTLNFIGETPEEYEVFAGLGRFKRSEGYDFENGRPLTTSRPEEQPGFTEIWKQAYDISPTVSPEKRVKNPMPRMRNPDPKGYLMMSAEKQVENEQEGNKSVAELMTNKSDLTENQKETKT